ncbi:MAG: glucose/galactose MFS transporter [Prevotellaceae bacterium]|jgi:fucose permease|nr:glucose/galactose MFS transporter [Prevotellaceae bacterium]
MKQENSPAPEAYTVGALFFICGFIAWLNATLIPYLKVACELSNFQAYFVTLAFYLACVGAFLPSLRLLRKTDAESGMVMGLMAMSAGALIFVPAALLRAYPLFLLGLAALGAGLGLLQAAASPCIAAFAETKGAPRCCTVAGICSKAAGVAGTLAVGGILFYRMSSLEASIQISEGVSRAAELDTLSRKAVLPCLAIMLALAAAAFWVKSLPLSGVSSAEKKVDGGILRSPRFWLGVSALFLYAGAEVTAVGSIALYGKSAGMSFEVAGALPACWLFAAILGCLLGVFAVPNVPKRISTEVILAFCAALCVIFSVVAVNTDGLLSVVFVALLGLSGALVWPSVFSLSAKGLGGYTRAGQLILATGAAGGALLPLAYGYLADTVGYRQAYQLLIPCYAAMLLYAAVNLPSFGGKSRRSEAAENLTTSQNEKTPCPSPST